MRENERLEIQTERHDSLLDLESMRQAFAGIECHNRRIWRFSRCWRTSAPNGSISNRRCSPWSVLPQAFAASAAADLQKWISAAKAQAHASSASETTRVINEAAVKSIGEARKKGPAAVATPSVPDE